MGEKIECEAKKGVEQKKREPTDDSAGSLLEEEEKLF